MSIESIFEVNFSDLLLSWDGKGWNDLFLGGFLLGLSLENFLEELLVLLSSTFVLRRVLSIAVASTDDNDKSNDNDGDHTSWSGFLSIFKSFFGSIKARLSILKLFVSFILLSLGGIFWQIINSFLCISNSGLSYCDFCLNLFNSSFIGGPK